MVEKTLDIVVGAYIVKKQSILQRGKVLLIYHKRYKKWLPVGGHTKRNELPDDAVRREVREEVGLEVDFLEYPNPRPGNEGQYALPFFTHHHPIYTEGEGHSHFCYYYLCSPKSDEVKPQRREVQNYGWFNKNELNSLDPPIPEGVKRTCREAITRASRLKIRNFLKFKFV
jgi:8-oxo-dGTP pyrophosphatase MutT (NUDIX family)